MGAKATGPGKFDVLLVVNKSTKLITENLNCSTRNVSASFYSEEYMSDRSIE